MQQAGAADQMLMQDGSMLTATNMPRLWFLWVVHIVAIYSLGLCLVHSPLCLATLCRMFCSDLSTRVTIAPNHMQHWFWDHWSLYFQECCVWCNCVLTAAVFRLFNLLFRSCYALAGSATLVEWVWEHISLSSWKAMIYSSIWIHLTAYWFVFKRHLWLVLQKQVTKCIMQFMDLGIHLCTVCKYWDVDQPWVQLHVLMCNKQARRELSLPGRCWWHSWLCLSVSN